MPGCAPGERPLCELAVSPIFASLPTSGDEFNRLYEETFGLLVSNACPPYETDYIDGKLTFQRSNMLADVSGFYRAFGVSPSQQHPERPDHIVLELEFMAFLIGLTRQAEAAGPGRQPGRVETCLDAQARFLREHLTWWTPAFARLLGHEGQGGFYEAVAHFLAAFITAERTLFEIAPHSVRAVPSGLERPEACEGCLLGMTDD